MSSRQTRASTKKSQAIQQSSSDDCSSALPSTPVPRHVAQLNSGSTPPPKRAAFWSTGFSPIPGSNSLAMQSNADTTPIGKISELPKAGYFNNFISGRVCYKSAIRAIDGSNGVYQVFSFDLMDMSGIVRITCFGDQADKNFAVVEMNKCFKIKNIKTKEASSTYTPPNIPIEASTLSTTVIMPTDDKTMPWIKFNFYKLAQLNQLQDLTNVDVIAVVVEVSEIQTYQKDGKQQCFRRLKLVDMSETEINLTLFGEDANQYESKGTQIVCAKNAQKSTYQGVATLTCCRGCTIWNGDGLKESEELMAWIKGFELK